MKVLWCPSTQVIGLVLSSLEQLRCNMTAPALVETSCFPVGAFLRMAMPGLASICMEAGRGWGHVI